MAQVVAFPAFAPRTAPVKKKIRSDGDDCFGRVIVFTGVWHERVGQKASNKRQGTVVQTKK